MSIAPTICPISEMHSLRNTKAFPVGGKENSTIGAADRCLRERNNIFWETANGVIRSSHVDHTSCRGQPRTGTCACGAERTGTQDNCRLPEAAGKTAELPRVSDGRCGLGRFRLLWRRGRGRCTDANLRQDCNPGPAPDLMLFGANLFAVARDAADGTIAETPWPSSSADVWRAGRTGWRTHAGRAAVHRRLQ